MVRLAANLSFLFKEQPFMKRFGAAAACGFRHVEFMCALRRLKPTTIPTGRL
jgi:hydroxypyruvate isomerase